jgi:hypothetical protein
MLKSIQAVLYGVNFKGKYSLISVFLSKAASESHNTNAILTHNTDDFGTEPLKIIL